MFLPDEEGWRRDSLYAVLVLYPCEQASFFHEALGFQKFRRRDVRCPLQPSREVFHPGFEEAPFYLHDTLVHAHVYAISILLQYSCRICLTCGGHMTKSDAGHTPGAISPQATSPLLLSKVILQSSPLCLDVRELSCHLFHHDLPDSIGEGRKYGMRALTLIGSRLVRRRCRGHPRGRWQTSARSRQCHCNSQARGWGTCACCENKAHHPLGFGHMGKHGK